MCWRNSAESSDAVNSGKWIHFMTWVWGKWRKIRADFHPLQKCVHPQRNALLDAKYLFQDALSLINQVSKAYYCHNASWWVTRTRFSGNKFLKKAVNAVPTPHVFKRVCLFEQDHGDKWALHEAQENQETTVKCFRSPRNSPSRARRCWVSRNSRSLSSLSQPPL